VFTLEVQREVAGRMMMMILYFTVSLALLSHFALSSWVSPRVRLGLGWVSRKAREKKAAHGARSWGSCLVLGWSGAGVVSGSGVRLGFSSVKIAATGLGGVGTGFFLGVGGGVSGFPFRYTSEKIAASGLGVVGAGF